MQIGKNIRKIREAKELSQKEVSISVGMDQAQYSRIENGKTDPSFSTIEKIAKALGVTLSELFNADDIFKEVNSKEKTLMEKIRLIELLEDKEQKAFYNILDALVAKKRLTDTLSDALKVAH